MLSQLPTHTFVDYTLPRARFRLPLGGKKRRRRNFLQRTETEAKFSSCTRPVLPNYPRPCVRVGPGTLEMS